MKYDANNQPIYGYKGKDAIYDPETDEEIAEYEDRSIKHLN